MSEQNGVSNGVGDPTTKVDDTNGGVPAQMMIVDETDDSNKDRRSSLSSRDSLNSDGHGQDNPAFEGDDSSLGKSDEVSKNGTTISSSSHPAVNGNNKEDVEMVPLNPTANLENLRNGTGVNHTNGQSTNHHKDQNKSALDSMYNDYFQPVNTRRKLLRGEKLYVTRDQRAHSRGWKWIAFWGGVFTFVAAALLTGILAATGIIMSKSEPSYSSSHRLHGNESSNDTINDFEFDVTNMTHLQLTTTPVPSETSNVDNNAESDVPPNSVTTEFPVPFTDIENSLEDGGVTPVGENLTPSPDSGITALNITTTTEAMATSIADPNMSTVVSNDVHHPTHTPIVDKGRSLDEEVYVTDLPLEDDTLFPSINETLLEDNSTSGSEEKTFLYVSNATNDELSNNYDGLSTVSAVNSALNNVADAEDLTVTTDSTTALSHSTSNNQTPLPKDNDNISESTYLTYTEMAKSTPLLTSAAAATPPNTMFEETTITSTEDQDSTSEVPQMLETTSANIPVLFPKSFSTTENDTTSSLDSISYYYYSTSSYVSPSVNSLAEEQPSTTLTSAVLILNASELNTTEPASTVSQEYTSINSSLETTVVEAEVTTDSLTTELSNMQPIFTLDGESSSSANEDLVSKPLSTTTNPADIDSQSSTVYTTSISTISLNSTTSANSTAFEDT